MQVTCRLHKHSVRGHWDWADLVRKDPSWLLIGVVLDSLCLIVHGLKRAISSSHLCKMQLFIMIRGANFIWTSARDDSNIILSLCFSYYPECLFEKPSKALSEEAGKMGEPCLEGFVICRSNWKKKKHEREKCNIHISPFHICGLFKNSLSSNRGRKTCRTVKSPQGIYVCFQDCSLTASKCSLKGCPCVPELSFVLALIAEGLYREPPQRASVVNDLVIFCQVTFSTRPLPWPSFSCNHSVCSTHWPGLGRLELPSQ